MSLQDDNRVRLVDVEPILSPEERADAETSPPPPDPPSKIMMIIAWIACITAVFSLAAIGPFFLWLEQKYNVKPIMSAVWRNETIVLFLLIPTIVEMIRTPSKTREQWFKKPTSGWDLKLILLANSVTWAASLILYVWSLNYTTAVRAALMSNLYPIMLVIYCKVRGLPVSMGELGGVIFATVGVAVTMFTSLFDTSEQHSWSDRLIGDVMCIGASIALALDIPLTMAARQRLPLVTYTWLMTLVLTFSLGIASYAFDKSTFDMEPHGFFGWCTSELAWKMLLFGFIGGVCGFLGFNMAVAYISPVLFSTVQLLDPVLTGILSWLGHVEEAPKADTYIGGVMVVIGIFTVILFEHRRVKHEELARQGQRDFELDFEMTVGKLPEMYEQTTRRNSEDEVTVEVLQPGRRRLSISGGYGLIGPGPSSADASVPAVVPHR